MLVFRCINNFKIGRFIGSNLTELKLNAKKRAESGNFYRISNSPARACAVLFLLEKQLGFNYCSAGRFNFYFAEAVEWGRIFFVFHGIFAWTCLWHCFGSDRYMDLRKSFDVRDTALAAFCIRLGHCHDFQDRKISQKFFLRRTSLDIFIDGYIFKRTWRFCSDKNRKDTVYLSAPVNKNIINVINQTPWHNQFIPKCL